MKTSLFCVCVCVCVLSFRVHSAKGEPGDSGGDQLHGSVSRGPPVRLHLRWDQRQESHHLPVHGGQEGLNSEVQLRFCEGFVWFGNHINLFQSWVHNKLPPFLLNTSLNSTKGD